MALMKRRSPGRPKDERLQERRKQQILDKAAAVFSAQGYQNADVQCIADALRLSKGTIYHYFGSKEELFLSAVRRGVQQMQEEIRQAREGVEDPLQRIAAAVKTYLRFFKANPKLVELFIQERAQFRGRRKPVYFEQRDARRGPWCELVMQLIERGRIRRMPVERVIDVLGDVLYGTMFTNHFAGRDKAHQIQAQDVLDVMFNGILSEKERRQTQA
jgi:AcrR family transcriptional regulator